jgi:hypothetical protein
MRLKLVASFGRPLIAARTPQSSPFTNASGNLITTFIAPPFPLVANFPANPAPPPEDPNTSAGWFLVLNKISKKPQATGPGAQRVKDFLTDRYEFSVGAIMTDVNGEHHFGEDPEMDVGQ